MDLWFHAATPGAIQEHFTCEVYFCYKNLMQRKVFKALPILNITDMEYFIANIEKIKLSKTILHYTMNKKLSAK